MIRRFLLLFPCLVASASAATLQLEDGQTLSGALGETSGVAEDPTQPNPSAGEVRVTPILIVDDGLRRTYLSKFRVRDILEQEDERPLKIRLWQNHARHGGIVGSVGRAVRVTPFDEFGRRIYEMQAAGGSIAVVQGVTEVTPVYTRVRGLSAKPRSYVWDMRIATSSIPRETLSRILSQAISESDADARLQMVRLYLQSERYRDARRELESIIEQFPSMEDLEDDVRRLRQLGAESILKEIELRRSAGQHKLVRELLGKFPVEEVAGATLERVGELIEEIESLDERVRMINELLAQVVEAIDEPAIRKVAEETHDEIAAELGEASLPRMTAFVQLAQGDSISAEQKASLAISGWLLGANQATDNLQISLSLYDIRAKVLAYLREPVAAVRDELLVEIRDMEGATVPRIAQLLKLIKPPLPIPEEAKRSGGLYELASPLASGVGDVRYLAQLPLEYNPLRKYPAIITLNGLGFRPELQLDYWAGGVGPDGVRRGQAMRRGYITIAVDWQKPKQFEYEYSSREHLAVLACYRDALRRFAIDTDRVFLTGHDIGADAAWDIALAHPDLWAGAAPILGKGRKYVGWYWKNAEYVPWRIVDGELNSGSMARNARELDRYLSRARFDATVVEYLGRGHEPFTDEIQRLFEWMERRPRRSAPKEFEVSSMRPWDNFFWWVELKDLPEKSMVHPGAWPPSRGIRAARVRGRTYESNKLGVFARAGKTTVWLSPDVVDFGQPLTVELNGRPLTRPDDPIRPDLRTLLEDVRTRGDRYRPFWAKLESR